MDDIREIKSLGDGRYTFWIGRGKYTLSTKIDSARFLRIVETVGAVADAFPQNLGQDERLVLSLLALGNRVEELNERIAALNEKFGGSDGTGQ
ncbi:MAG: hypothetical protein IJM42_05820 [Synergistes sp.]|nr:hypothetical protein [Synergistes sp.]MCR5336045.1 hypothetical protein [Synergistes sp.]